MAVERDWSEWHSPYDDPDSPLSRRLAIVQRHIDGWLDETFGPLQVLSSCAGDGRDLLGVLARRPDAGRVSAALLETDDRNVARARREVAELGLAEVQVRQADAGTSDAYAGLVPAQLVLLCGIFGNIADLDVHRLVSRTPQLCDTGARVIWTRHTRAPDLTPQIRQWFTETGFEEVAFTAPSDVAFSVGVTDFHGKAAALARGERWFTFLR